MKQSRTGRPTKFTDSARHKIVESLRAGLTRTAAASMAGVHKSQVTRWYAGFATFATECDIAEAQAEARFTLILTEAAQTDPKYALEWLKRRRRGDWGDHASVGLDDRIADIMAELAGTSMGRTYG